MQNQGVKVTTHFENDDININRLKMDIIRLLREFLLPIFHKHVYERWKEEWETLMDEGWQEIGIEIFDKDIWSKTDGDVFVGTVYFICEEREWNGKLAIDVILIALERQTISPIINCKNLNHMVSPL